MSVIRDKRTWSETGPLKFSEIACFRRDDAQLSRGRFTLNRDVSARLNFSLDLGPMHDPA
jgi:hypothetical protein